MTQFVSNKEIYEATLEKALNTAQHSLWIATADIKDVYVSCPYSDQKVPLLQILAEHLTHGLEVRLLHAKEPGPNFRADFERFPILWESLERALCPRVHFKCMIVDQRWAYFGSANLTGAGMGAKHIDKRNFENGIITDDLTLLHPLIAQFDDIWQGNFCATCKRREYCSDPIDQI